MDKEPTARLLWRIKATAVLQRVAEAESRFSVSMPVNEVAMLAAADELQAATWDAKLWTTVNACPDEELGGHIALMLNTCAEIALTAQRTIFDPSVDKEAVFDRLGELVAVIECQSQTLGAL